MSSTPPPPSLADAFAHYYAPQGSSWGGGSGAGSDPYTTVPYRAFLETFIGFNGIRSIVDVGCGDWRFSRFINLDGINYTGFDVVQSVIDANRTRYARPGVTFNLMPNDITDVPSGDLLIMKDVLQHLSIERIVGLRELLFPKFKYCLLTNSFSKPNTPINTDIVDGNFRSLDLSAHPFHLDGAYVLEFSSPLWERIRTYLHQPKMICDVPTPHVTQNIVFMQTADDRLYKNMLDVSSITNIEYCRRNGFRYESYVGIKSGAAPWMASYNRIFMLQELVQRGHRGWVIFADADAFVVDLSFDVLDYLDENSDYCLIGASGGSDAPWNLNSGILFINLADPIGRAFVADWMTRFRIDVPLDYLADASAKWDEYPNDQDIMYQCIKHVPGLMAKTKREDPAIFNYTSGRFMWQAIRTPERDVASRIEIIRSKVTAVMSGINS
jgi:SAM-dependent methyltransferase